jgi:hypothetical protein
VTAALALLVFSINWAGFLIIAGLPHCMSAVCTGCAHQSPPRHRTRLRA